MFCITPVAKDIRELNLASIPARLAGDVALTYLAATTRKPGVRPLHLSWSQMPGGGRHNTVTVRSHGPAAHSDLPVPHSWFVRYVPSKPIKQRASKVSHSPELLPWLNRALFSTLPSTLLQEMHQIPAKVETPDQESSFSEGNAVPWPEMELFNHKNNQCHLKSSHRQPTGRSLCPHLRGECAGKNKSSGQAPVRD